MSGSGDVFGRTRRIRGVESVANCQIRTFVYVMYLIVISLNPRTRTIGGFPGGTPSDGRVHRAHTASYGQTATSSTVTFSGPLVTQGGSQERLEPRVVTGASKLTKLSFRNFR